MTETKIDEGDGSPVESYADRGVVRDRMRVVATRIVPNGYAITTSTQGFAWLAEGLSVLTLAVLHLAEVIDKNGDTARTLGNAIASNTEDIASAINTLDRHGFSVRKYEAD